MPFALATARFVSGCSTVDRFGTVGEVLSNIAASGSKQEHSWTEEP